ncbi:MAG: pitrilysin family protein [candidate division Zixibacteria bacterium]|nr:pitrilysin family protein [candidate division Zixibacteria bacterium]
MTNSKQNFGSGDIRKTTLRNGLRVITETIPSVRSVSMGVWVDVGSRHETDNVKGVSHLIEHMVFKGTKRRTAKQIASDLESIGGNLNAFTSREQTCFTARVLDEYIETALDVLSDITCHATMTPTNIKREKMVIIEEIKESVDNPSDQIHDIFAKTYWDDDPLGTPIMGSVESIKNMSRKNIVNYLKSNYRTGSIVIVATGAIKHDKFLKKVKKYFSFESGKAIEVMPPTRNETKKKIIEQIDNNQTHLAIGFPGISYSDKNRMASIALSTYLGGGMSSVLFQKIREQKGLAYSVFAFNDVYRDTGIFGAYLGTDRNNLKLALDILLKECLRMKKNRLTNSKLDLIKAQIKGQITLGLESTTSRMLRLGRQELMMGRLVTLPQTLELIDQITSSDILELSNRIFDLSRMTVAVLGPVEKSDLDHV